MKNYLGLAPFALSAWELPEGSSIPRAASADARFWTHFHGHEQNVLVRRVEIRQGFSVLFVRGENDDDEASWTPLQRGAESAHWPILSPAENWPQHIAHATFGRVVWFEGAMALLHADGRAMWRPVVASQEIEAPFRWHDGQRNWNNAPAREWKDALEILLQNPDSDARFAHRWIFWNEQKRRETALECDGGWSQFHELLRWMLTAQPGLETSKTYSLSVLLLHSGNDLYLEFFSLYEVRDGDLFDVRVDWLVDWENLMNGLFPMRHNRELMERHECVVAEFPLDRGQGVSVERAPISHHERLEALLRLNEWARARGVQMLSGNEERLDLEAWELRPGSPETREGAATVSMRAKWLGEEREFLWREVEMAPGWFVTFARVRDGSLAGNFALCGSSWEDDHPGIAGSGKRVGLAPLWCELREFALLARLFFFDFSRWGEMGSGDIALGANGKGHLSWNCAQSSRVGECFEQGPFFWKASGLAGAPSHEWLARIETELSNENSDVRAALRRVQLESQERSNEITQ